MIAMRTTVWCTAVIELSQQEVGQHLANQLHASTVKDNHDSSGSDFIDMVITAIASYFIKMF